MPAKIYTVDGKLEREVRNLGWLLRHSAEVKSISYGEERGRPWAGMMNAYLTDGRRYHCAWADTSLFRRWVRRPRFRGVPLHIHLISPFPAADGGLVWIYRQTTCDQA